MPHAKPVVSLAALVVLMLSASLVTAQKQVQSVPHYTNLEISASRITTLYALDPAASSLCFADGDEGHVIRQGVVYNRCSHIEFDHYYSGSLTVAIQGGEEGQIIDLGTPDELKKQYGYSETVSSGQGFASLVFRDGKIQIRKAGEKGELQALTGSQQLLEQPVKGGASAIAKAGHIYLARITDRHNKDFQILVKILVLRAAAGDQVTFRWELL